MEALRTRGSGVGVDCVFTWRGAQRWIADRIGTSTGRTVLRIVSGQLAGSRDILSRNRRRRLHELDFASFRDGFECDHPGFGMGHGLDIDLVSKFDSNTAADCRTNCDWTRDCGGKHVGNCASFELQRVSWCPKATIVGEQTSIVLGKDFAGKGTSKANL